MLKTTVCMITRRPDNDEMRKIKVNGVAETKSVVTKDCRQQ